MIRPLLGFAVATLFLMSGFNANAQPDCAIPANAPRVDADHTPNPSGAYYKLDNHRDTDANGKINPTDYFNWRMPPQGAVRMSDPSIMYLPSQYGNWYYITGSDQWASYRNHAIYRTRDFSTFELHMYAFDNINDETDWTGSGQ